MIDFDKYLEHSLDDVQDSKVKEACLYSLMAGGKRIRPALLFKTLEIYHCLEDKGINAAIALEMIHTYSLIHDDLPAMDNDDLRRGKPSCHKKFGEDIAILAGDALLTQAFLYASEATDSNITNKHIIKELVECAGMNGMIYGQELDIANEKNKDLDIKELSNINIFKTGKLITLSFVLGALVCGRGSDLDVWRKIGNNIGLLFQIQDDILDATSSEENTGKSVKSDIKNNKTTYVSLLGINKCNETISRLYADSVELLDSLVIEKEPMIEMFKSICDRKN